LRFVYSTLGVCLRGSSRREEALTSNAYFQSRRRYLSLVTSAATSAVTEVAVDDFAEADGAAEHFGEHERIERQRQLVVLGELVAVDETDGNELRRLAPAGGRNAFDGLEASLNGCSRRQEVLTVFGGRSLSLVTSAATKLDACRYIHGELPLGSLQGFR
jgi:hypothetical protein